ncbi:MAG: hypothetical protein WAW96_21060 [Alphaproteobacteria bacterium]
MILRVALIAFFASLVGAAAIAAPSSDAAHYQRCVLQVAQNPSAALEAAKSWEAEDGGGPAGHCEALALLALKRPADAATRLEALAIAPGDYDTALRADLYAQAGNAWLVAEKPDKAIDDLNAAIDRARSTSIGSAKLSLYYSDRARAHLLRGERVEAQGDLDHSIALAPTALALTLHARVRREAKDGKTAAADLSRALSLDPNFAEAYLERGRLSAANGNAKTARADFLKAAMMEKDGNVADAARLEMQALDVRGAR